MEIEPEHEDGHLVCTREHVSVSSFPTICRAMPLRLPCRPGDLQDRLTARARLILCSQIHACPQSCRVADYGCLQAASGSISSTSYRHEKPAKREYQTTAAFADLTRPVKTLTSFRSMAGPLPRLVSTLCASPASHTAVSSLHQGNFRIATATSAVGNDSS